MRTTQEVPHTGTLMLDCDSPQPGVSRLRRQYCDGALRIFRPQRVRDGQPGQLSYIVATVGGGYLDGDRYDTQVTVRQQAAVELASQAATKVYRTPTRAVRATLEAHLEEDAVLDLLPQPLILYRGASYEQFTTLHLTSRSHCVTTDIVTPGWHPEGHSYAYDRVRLRTDIFVDGRRCLRDHLHLSPTTSGSPAMISLGMMEGYSHMGSLLMVSPTLCEQTYQTMLPIIDQHCGPDLSAGITFIGPHKEGCAVRTLAHNTHHIEALHTDLVHKIRSLRRASPYPQEDL